MKKCEFSETQFEAYHSRSIENEFGSETYQFFPSRNEEGAIGVDMAHFGPAVNLFFQYKVPCSLKRRSRRTGDLPGNLYKFDIYHHWDKYHKRTGQRLLSQYELLWKWSETEPFVFYTAPVFNTYQQFSRHYKNIVPYSRHFNVKQMIDPSTSDFDYQSHAVYFSDGGHTGYMCSKDPRRTKELQGDLESSEAAFFGDSTYVHLASYIWAAFASLEGLLGKPRYPVKRPANRIRDEFIATADGENAYGLIEVEEDRKLPDRRIFEQLQSLDAQAFYLRSLIRENLNLEWLIVKHPYFVTNDDIYN